MSDRTVIVTERSLIDLIDLSRRAADVIQDHADPVLASALHGSVAEVEAQVRPLARI